MCPCAQCGAWSRVSRVRLGISWGSNKFILLLLTLHAAISLCVWRVPTVAYPAKRPQNALLLWYLGTTYPRARELFPDSYRLGNKPSASGVGSWAMSGLLLWQHHTADHRLCLKVDGENSCTECLGYFMVKAKAIGKCHVYHIYHIYLHINLVFTSKGLRKQAIFLHLSIVDIQCDVSFRGITYWFSFSLCVLLRSPHV